MGSVDSMHGVRDESDNLARSLFTDEILSRFKPGV
jgi:hypothetical protein